MVTKSCVTMWRQRALQNFVQVVIQPASHMITCLRKHAAWSKSGSILVKYAQRQFIFDTLCYTKLMAVIITIRIGDRIDNNIAAQWEYNILVAQFPQNIGPIYHNASFLADICTRVHISATKGCIVGYSVDYGISEVGQFDEQSKKRHSFSSCLALVKCTSWYPLANTLNWQSNNG